MMNKLTTFILFFLLAGYIGLNAQESAATAKSTYPLLLNKLEKSDKDLDNPKKNVSAKYWLSRADLMMDAYEVNLKHLIKGQQQIMLVVQFGDPIKKSTETADGLTLEVYEFERVTIKFSGGVVHSYEETKPLYDNALNVALEAMNKAEELDAEGKLTKKIKPAYSRLSELYKRAAIEVFLKEEFAESFKNFEQAVLIIEKPFMEGVAVDTSTIFNTGMAASRANLNDESIKYYELALSYNYPEPSLYVFLKNKYFAKGDTAKGIEILNLGFDTFPNEQDIVVELINYYLLGGKGEEALNYIKIAQEKDPENVSLVFAEATLYDKQGEVEKSIATYQKCIELDPSYFNSYYNLGVVHYNHAQKLFEDANSASDDTYESIAEQGNEELRKAIPLMKKCHELNPDDISVLETLKSIYYRLKMDAEYEEIKNKING